MLSKSGRKRKNGATRTGSNAFSPRQSPVTLTWFHCYPQVRVSYTGFDIRAALRVESICQRRRSRRAHGRVQLRRSHARRLARRRQDRPRVRGRVRLPQPRLGLGLRHARHRDADVARDRPGGQGRGRQGRHGSGPTGRKDVGRNACRRIFHRRMLGRDCLWVVDRVHVPRSGPRR